VLLDAAVAVAVEHGPAGLSLREIARRCGVSHAAPVHHFGDKAGLLTAVATQGYQLLGAALADAAARTADFAELGVAYVLFAAGYPGHFAVMFRPELYHGDDPALGAARARTAALLHEGAQSTFGPADRVPALAAWSLVHGLATLILDGNIDLEPDADLEALARAVTRRLG